VIAEEAGNRAHVDDRRSGRHEGGERLDAKQRPVDIDRHHPVELGQRYLVETLAQRDAGVVDQAVDATVALADPRGELRPRRLGGHVENARDDRRRELRHAHVGGDHRRSLRGESPRLGRALAAG
jgi:hypothetical protein